MSLCSKEAEPGAQLKPFVWGSSSPGAGEFFSVVCDGALQAEMLVF